MKYSISLHAVIVLSLIYNTTQAQTLNWSNSFSPAWVNDEITGTASNISNSGINCTVSVYKSGGVFYTSHGSGAVPTPTVSGSPFIIAGSSSNLEIAADFDNKAEFINIVFNFSTAVSNIQFDIGDIDKPSPTDLSHQDKVIVTGSDGISTHLPVLSKVDAATEPDFLLVSGMKQK